jgi:hypothetical protein
MRPKTQPRRWYVATMHRRLALAMATLVLACLSLPGGASAASEGSKAAEQALIEAYTPRLMVREKTEICDTDGEQYEATTVDTVLGNPAVELTEADEDGDEMRLKRSQNCKSFGRRVGLGR